MDRTKWMRDLGTLLPLAMFSVALLGIAVCRDLRRSSLSRSAAIALLLVCGFVPFPRTWLIYLPVFHSLVHPAWRAYWSAGFLLSCIGSVRLERQC